MLAITAGYVDAVSFFGSGVFTTNMTGNMIRLGGAIASHWFPHVQETIGIQAPLLAIIAFAAGASVAALTLRGKPSDTRVRQPLLIGIGVILIVCGLLWPRVPLGSLIDVLSATMGVQSVVALRIGMKGVSTTYVTGTMISAVMLLAEPLEKADVRIGARDAMVWAVYLGGAIAGAAGEALFGTRSLLAAGAVVVISAAVL
ncbi:MAG TPA: YoaK family protein [Candidatus Tumulicola sp.]